MIVDDKLRAIEEKFEGLAADLADPALIADREKYQLATKAYSDLQPLVEASRLRRKLASALAQARTMFDEAGGDPELKALAREEVESLQAGLAKVEDRLTALLVPRDPNDERN